jgi:uncharacterized membrane protein YedE/YeeE
VSVLAALASRAHGGQSLVLLGIGLLLGAALFHARFGFTGAWRQLVAVGQTAGARAHVVMLATAAVLFAPILAAGQGLFGTHPRGNVDPISVGLVVGAVLFGLGMQLASACASGTLFVLGGGNTLMLITLSFFIGGSVLGTATWGFWSSGELSAGPVSLASSTGLGYGGALVVELAALGAVALLLRRISRREAPPAGRPATARGFARVMRGSWSLMVGAVALAVLNAATLLVRGKPWGVSSGFALWGGKALQALGVDVGSWSYWQGSRGASLHEPLLVNSTTVLDLGILAGAAAAAAASGSFALTAKLPRRAATGAAAGGLLMGYGARLAYGCNIGSYFGGIASFSAHGWVWACAALVGTWLGLRARGALGLAVPRRSDPFC